MLESTDAKLKQSGITFPFSARNFCVGARER